MLIKLKQILVGLMALLCINAKAQAVNKGKIMVVPFIKEGEQYRTVLDEDILRRIAVTKVKEGFDNNSYTTVDFVAKLKASKTSETFTSENQADIKSKMLSNSGCDIYVIIEVNKQQDNTGSSVTVILSAHEVSSGNSIANKVGSSGKFTTTDFNKLTEKAVEKCINEFIDVLNEKSIEMQKKGSTLTVDISFAESATNDFTTEMGNDKIPLSDILIEWFGKNSQDGNYHLQGTTKLKMIFDDVKMPLKDAKGETYNSNKYALAIYQFLKSLGLKPGKEVISNTIYITIN